MAQNALATTVAVQSGVSKPLLLDAQQQLNVNVGGTRSALNLTAAAVIKATPGRLVRINIIAPGSTGGTFTFNDCATTGAASAANTIFKLAFDAAANVAGASFVLEWPCTTGIVLSAVPTGGSPVVAVSYI